MIGRSLSQFTITAKLGEGGMGEVYRAVDAKLGREVAIKVLPPEFTSDPERLARFEREAKLLASLNHQNIAAIHQVEQVEGLHFLVMELVEGETLAERLERGAMPAKEALPAALQITQALEAAHEKGIVHRDLKPANIKITPEGQVKVLDFGLAKTWESDERQPDLSRSPTMTAQMTRAGMILGTAAYMSPEQAKGQSTDRRTDIWAFGVVLWEMLGGKSLFAGDSVAETLASVLKTEIDLDPLPSRTPPRIRRLLERCLRRDPRSRLRDIGDARIALEEMIADKEWKTAGSATTPGAARIPAMGAALLVLAGLALGAVLSYLWLGRGTGPADTVTSVAIPIGSTLRIGQKPLLTPDGRTAVFRATDVDPEADHQPALYVRRLEDNRITRLDGTEDVRAHAVSPDGRWIAFLTPVSRRSSRYQIVKVPIDGSAPPSKIADWPDGTRFELIWPSPEKILAFRFRDGAIISFSPDGGPPGAAIEIRTDLNPSWVAGYSAVPGGRHVLVTYPSFSSGAYRQDAGLLDPETGELRNIVDEASHPWYASSGHLVFGRRGALLAAPFDLGSLQVTGGVQTVLDGIWSEGLYTGGTFSISAGGDLLYGAGQVQGLSRSVAILSRDGNVTDWSVDRLLFNEVWGSPDGRRLAVQIDNIGEGDALLQIRVSELDQPRLVTVGAQPGKDCGRAAWSTDSRHVAYICWDHEMVALYSVRVGVASTSRTLLEEKVPADLGFAGFTAGDSSILLRRVDAGGSPELVSVPFGENASGEPRPVAIEEKDWFSPSVSADGRWLAYVASEAGRRQVYVRELLGDTSVGPRIPASSESFDDILWSNAMLDGRYELLGEKDGKHFSLEVTTSPMARVSDPRVLDYDPFVLGIQGISSLPDGRLLIVRAPDTEMGAPELRLILNWTQRLTSQVPVRGR